jgi:DNA-binding response OmpR family regulator
MAQFAMPSWEQLIRPAIIIFVLMILWRYLRDIMSLFWKLITNPVHLKYDRPKAIFKVDEEAPQYFREMIPGFTLADVRILIIEDNEDVVTALRMTLESERAVCRWLSSATPPDAQSLVDDILSFRPHVIIRGIWQPGMDGFDFIQALHLKLEEIPPLIVISARDHSDDIAKTFDLKADAYIAKPFESEMLLQCLLDVLKKRGIYQKLDRPLARDIDEDSAKELFKVGMSPEEWVARHSHGVGCSSFDQFTYRDKQLQAQVDNIHRLMRAGSKTIGEFRKKYLSPEEIKRIEEIEKEDF